MNPDDIWKDPRTTEFFADATENMVPKLRESAFTIQIAPGEPDPKSAIELGYTILLDKPLIVVVPEDRTVPERLRRAADAVIEWGEGGQDLQDRIVTAMHELIREEGTES